MPCHTFIWVSWWLQLHISECARHGTIIMLLYIYIFIVFTVTYAVYICVLYPYMSTSIGSIVPSWLKSCINAVWHRGIQDIQFSGCGSLDPWRKRTSNSIRWALRFKVSRLLSKYFHPPPFFLLSGLTDVFVYLLFFCGFCLLSSHFFHCLSPCFFWIMP